METSDGAVMHSCKMYGGKWEYSVKVSSYLILKSFNPKNPVQHMDRSRSSHF